ncbi:MAG: hypothetical protein ACI9R3_004701 [Verrucomicrobiales bacterium]|jgi:hypothetical protein
MNNDLKRRIASAAIPVFNTSMKTRRSILTILLAASLLPAFALPVSVNASGRKKGDFFVSFHVEGDKSEGERRVAEDVVNGRQVYFKRMPVVTHKDMRGYWPFPADDGTWGAAFKLSSSGQRRLNTAGLTERKRLMRVVVNMRKVDVLYIDEAPEDGMIVVWKGLTEEELKKLEKKMPQLKSE